MQEFRVFRAIGLSFKSWFRNFFPFTILTNLLYSPVFIWLATYDFSKTHSIDEAIEIILVRPVYVLVGLSTLVAPMLTYRVVQELNGTKVSMFTSIKYGLRGVLPALFLAIIVNVVQLLPMGGIAGAIFTCIWFVAAPAAVAEKLGPIQAFTRSAALTQGRRWGIFGLTFLIGLILVVFLLAWIIPKAQGGEAAFLADIRSIAIIFFAVMGAFQMFNGIVEAVSYCLLRQDKEGITHEELARVFE